MSLHDKLFKTPEGKIVYGEKPNSPIILAATFYALSWVLNGDLSVGAAWMGRIALIYWSYLEITSGVNLFRKLLGAAFALFVLVSLTVNLL